MTGEESAGRAPWAPRWAVRLGAVSLLLIIAWSFRFELLGVAGRMLIRTDKLAHADAIVVLGGSPIDRAPEGARLLREGWSSRLVFTGGRIDQALLVYGISRSEAAHGRDAALLDSSLLGSVVLLEEGTSTLEEAEAIRGWSRMVGADTIIVVTTDFHTRRAGWVFRKAMGAAGIHVIMHGSASKEYDPERWWESEQGLIMVNNEWMKTLYYAVRH